MAINNTAVYAEFNGYNHHDLAKAHNISVLDVYNALIDQRRLKKKLALIKAVETVVAAPQHYQALPEHLRSVVVHAVHAQAGSGAAEKLLSLCSDAQPVVAECPVYPVRHPTTASAIQFQVRQIALQWLEFVRSFSATHFVKR